MLGFEDPVSDAAMEEGLETVREHRNQLHSMFTKLVPDVLDAFLSGSSLEDALKDFIRTNSPRFKNFTEEGECELMMSDVHSKYVAMVEELVEAKTKEWPIDLDAAFFAKASGKGIESLLEKATRVLDFVSFGRMMRQKYEEQLAAAAIRPGGRTHVRVLWDFENVNPLRSSERVQDAAERLEKFLRDRLCRDANVDYVTTAFMPPTAVNETVLTGLDRATVVIILCSTKREDADRKLVDALDRETRNLDPTQTTFVLVSSDTDFKSKLQNLRAQGYRTVSVHEYDTKCSARQALEQHADHAFFWGEIIGSKGKAPDPQDDPQPVKTSAPAVTVPAVKPTVPAVKPTPSLRQTREGLPIYPKLAYEDKLVGMVAEWKEQGGFGFIRVWTESSTGYIDFFCHVTQLPRLPRGCPKYLVPGELVTFIAKPAQYGKKNPQASNVRAFVGRLSCESRF